MTDIDDINPTEREAPPLPPPTPPPAREVPGYTSAQTPQRKIPGLAAVLSFIPGIPIGQLYAEAFNRALMIAAVFWLVLLSGVERVLPWTLVSFAMVFIWIYGMFDAFREAQLVNLGGVEPERPPRRGEGRLMFGVFLAVMGALLLAERLDLFDLEWLYDWWPVLVLAIGAYLIWGAVREKMRRRDQESLGSDADFEG